MNDGFPEPLSSLKQSCYIQISYLELLAECERVSLGIRQRRLRKQLGHRTIQSCGRSIGQAE